MKTFNKFKRVCAMTLTALMIIQQSNVTTFASDIEAAAEAAAQSEEEAQNAADGSKNNTAVETTSQETPAQPEPVQTESAQSEQVQEQQSQQQQETTPATEQQPAVTPETQKTTADTANAAQEQEATPEAQPTEEAQPVATEAVPTQEAEKETATVQDLSYNADGVQVKVHTNTAVAADTQLVVRTVNPDEFDNAALNQWMDDKQVAGAAVYDIHLADVGGNEISMGQASVSMNFSTPVVAQVEGVKTTLSFLHIANGSTVEVGQVNVEGTAASITANGFSPFVFVRTSEVAGEALINTTDANKYIKSVSIKTNGTPLDRNNGSIEGKFEFEIPNVDKNCFSVYFDIPVEYLSLIASTGNQVRDDNGTVIGSFTLDTTTGRVVMNFLDDYYKNNSEIKGYFQYDAKVKTDAIDDKDEITISFNDNVSATIQLKPGNINGWKDGKFELGEDGNLYINYEIWIDADSKLKNFKLEDALGVNLEYVPGSFTWKKGDNGAAQSVDPTVTGNKATYELGTIEKGKYCFAYKAKVIDKTSAVKLTNEAKWNWKGNTEGNSSSKEMQISKVSISKSGNNFSGRTTSWTVRLNKGDATTRNEMTEGKYTDKLPKGMSLVDGTLKIKDTQNGRELVNGTDYIFTPIADGFLIEFRDQGAVKVPSYEITYDTTLTGSDLPADNTQYKNEGIFTPNGGNPVKGEGTSSYKKDDSNRIKKQVSNVQYEENGDATSDWEIVIDPLGEELKDIEVSDTFDTSKHTGIVESSIKVKTESGQEITPTFYDSDTVELGGHDGYYQKFKMKLPGTYSEKIYVTYKAKTFYDDIKSAEVDIVNNAVVIVNNQWKGANDRFTYRKDSGAMTKSGSKDGSYFKWIVQMNIDPEYNWLAAKDYGEGDVLRMTDVIPEGMTLVQDVDKSPKVSCNYVGGEDLSSRTNCWNYDESTRTFTVNVSNFGKKFVWVVYWTKVNDNFINSGDYAFTNDASYSSNGKQMDSASATVIEKGKDLSKTSAEQTTDNIVTYTVDVNSDVKTLNDGNELTLTDKMPVGCSYVPKSITFLEGEDAVISREYKNGTLTLKIKDASHVKFTYELKVLGEIGDKVEVSNSITLTGKRTISSSDNKTVTITKTTAGASGEKGTFKVVKIDSKTEVPLKGATFILQKMKYSDGTFVNDGEPVAKTTDSTGGAAFGEKFVSNDQPTENSILYDTLYYWQEIKAPDGYSLSDSEKNTKHYFYIGGNSLATLQGWLAGAGTEFQNAEQVGYGNYVVSNTKIKTAKAQFEVEKVVSGEGAPGEEFTFTLEGKDNAPMPTEKKLKVKAGASEKFDEITYTTAGTYEYTITETKGETEGMTYDETAHKVLVTVTEAEGKLTAAVTYDGEATEKLTVTNTYKKPEKPAPTAATAQFEVAKVVSGEDAPADEEFTFALAGKDSTPMPEATSVKVKAGASAKFDEITYTTAGTYEYTITETKGETEGMTYDETAHKVLVTVTEAEGKLTAAVTYDGEATEKLTVTNTYKKPAPEATKAEIKVTKTVNGEGAPEEEFEFTLEGKDGAPMPVQATVKATAGETKSFGEITYTAAGTYQYTVKETKGATEGMTYDESGHEVVVTVAEKDGKLAATVSYDKKQADSLTVTNTYEKTAPEATEAQITAKKTVNGEAARGSLFQFTLTPKTAGDANKAQTVRNADGNITFNKLTYETAGTYKYEVSEVQEVPTGYTADTVKHEVTVEVADKDGQLVATVKYAEADKDGIVFANQYKPLATEAQITAKKTVNGEAAKGSLFQFTLTPKTAGDANKAQTVRNADGNITFNKLTYETAGTYKYEVSEVQEVPTGYTADTVKHEVTVEVVDKDGQLVAAVKYAEADKDGIVFENTYEKTFKIRKTDIGGKELKDAKFVLSGKEEGGKDITPISWTSDGTAKEITVKPGTYTLEETTAPEGYNTIQSKVTITVDKEGKITVNGKKVSEVSAEGDEIIVKDTLKGSSITVTKNLVHNGEALEAINATFYVALYNDEACTDRASDVKAIEFKNASASTASFTDVKVGKEYYVAECDENGNALTTGEIAGATFMANFSSSNKVSVEKENDSSIIYFTNEFLTIPDGFYKEGKLTITKKLLGTDGKAKNGDGKFYAGIFMDKDHTELADSNTVSANIVELDLNDVSEASQTVKFGVGKNDKLTFYIAETDAEGNPVADDEDFSYKVTYSAESATFDITHLSAAVTIVNRETSSEKTEITETTNKTSGSSNSTAKTAVKTGDNTPILPFVIILLAAIVAIVAIVVFVKKRFGSKKS